MKTIKHLTLTFVFAFFILCNKVESQKGNLGALDNWFASLNGASAFALDNLVLFDSAGMSNIIHYSASFDLLLGAEQEAITNFFSALKNNQSITVVLSRVNSNLDLIEERAYNNATISEMQLPELDASGRSVAKIRVKIKTTSVIEKFGANQKFSKPMGAKQKSALTSNFRFSFGSLETRRVAKIYGMSITNSGMLQFSKALIEMSLSDVKGWKELFQNNSGKSSNKTQAVIELLSLDMKTIVFQIDLSDAEIISYSYNDNNNTKGTFGIKVGNLSVSFPK